MPTPRFRVDPADVPAPVAARRLGLDAAVFAELLPRLVVRGFPEPDPDTGLFDLEAIDRWRRLRHPRLFPELTAAPGARDAGAVHAERLARMMRR
jgi:hypothetical protein